MSQQRLAAANLARQQAAEQQMAAVGDLASSATSLTGDYMKTMA